MERRLLHEQDKLVLQPRGVKVLERRVKGRELAGHNKLAHNGGVVVEIQLVDAQRRQVAAVAALMVPHNKIQEMAFSVFPLVFVFGALVREKRQVARNRERQRCPPTRGAWRTAYGAVRRRGRRPGPLLFGRHVSHPGWARKDKRGRKEPETGVWIRNKKGKREGRMHTLI